MRTPWNIAIERTAQGSFGRAPAPALRDWSRSLRMTNQFFVLAGGTAEAVLFREHLRDTGHDALHLGHVSWSESG